jgi:hypothetical protein
MAVVIDRGDAFAIRAMGVTVLLGGSAFAPEV